MLFHKKVVHGIFDEIENTVHPIRTTNECTVPNVIINGLVKVNLSNAREVNVYLLFTLSVGLVRLINNHLVDKLREKFKGKLIYLCVLLDGLHKLADVCLCLLDLGERCCVVA